MCGIACVVGSKKSPKYCYEALEKLEYRGYDSAGIAGITKDEIKVFKREGRVKNILPFVNKFKSKIVISHTRWATHGKPSEDNAHPHISYNKNYALVHNGIIENYLEIKDELENKGVAFKSQTDSEVVVNLLASLEGKLINKIRELNKRIKGTFALGIIDKQNKCLIGLRRKSPLYVAKTKQGYMLVSDVMCFSGLTKKYYPLKEGEFVIISKNKIHFYSRELKSFKPNYIVIGNKDEKTSKNGYQHYMEKEIKEIPAVIKKIVSVYKNSSLLENVKDLFEGVNNIKLIGCGTAYHASEYGAKLLEKTLKIPVSAYIASEFKYSCTMASKETLAIFVSQSGETIDTIGCAEIMKEKGAKTLAITNVENSLLTQICDKFLPVLAGKEIAVASTKAYVAQVLVLYILNRYLQDNAYDFEDISNLANSAEKLAIINEEIVDIIVNEPRVFYIGRQLDSITSLEAALKLKEITYKSAEGYPAGELKHGTIALIEEGTPVVVFATNRELFEKSLSALEEVKARGAKVILVAPKSLSCEKANFTVELPEEYNDDVLSILSIIPFQFLAYKVSVKLGYNPDKPRNLAKSVTVE